MTYRQNDPSAIWGQSNP